MKQMLILGLLSLGFMTSNVHAQTKLEESVKTVATEATKTTYADAKDATAVIYNDGKSLIKQIYEDGKSLAPDIKSAFKSLAEGFNTTVEKLWDILVRQQYVWSICYSVILILSLFAWIKFAKLIEKTSTDRSETGEIKTINIVYTAIIFILAIYGTTHVFENIDRMLTGFINPEFGAVRTIVEFIQK